MEKIHQLTHSTSSVEESVVSSNNLATILIVLNKFCRTLLQCLQGSDVFKVKSGVREESNKQGDISLVTGTRFS